MPWASGATIALPDGDTGEFLFAFFASPPGTNQVGVSIESSNSSLEDRLRVGFYYPCIQAGGRPLVGACNEMAGVASGTSTAIHSLNYGFAVPAFLTAATDEVYGVAIAAARGVSGAQVRLWRFT